MFSSPLALLAAGCKKEDDEVSGVLPKSVGTDVEDTGQAADTAPAEDTASPADTASSTQGPYPDEVVEVETYEELLTELGNLQTGHLAILKLSAEWCGPCQQFKPYYEYAADFTDGKYLWLSSWAEEDVNYEVWNNWGQGNLDAELASCWSASYYYPQLFVVEKSNAGDLTAHEMANRFYMFRYATESEIQSGNSYTDDAGNVITWNEYDSNEVVQVENGTHD